MSTQILRDKNGKKKGELREQGTWLRAYDDQGRYKGYYDTKTNKTYNANGSPIGMGNQAAVLIS